jgi:hypothetical protein
MELNSLEHKKSTVCDLGYLSELMGENAKLIVEIMNGFLKQLPDELKSINEAVSVSNFTMIKSLAHHLMSTVAIMGISILKPVLKELEELGSSGTGIDRIRELTQKVNAICLEATEEIICAKSGYVDC